MLINPVWYLKGAVSGAVDLKNHKPQEWEQAPRVTENA